MNKGSCLCGDISWEIDGEIVMRSNCHCSMCRKFHGAAYGSYIGVPAAAFKWTSGEDKIKTYESSPGGLRPFCPRCGSVVAAKMREGDSVFMPLGNMEGDIDRPLDSHIFAASKAPWFDITDDVPQHDEYPPEYDIPGRETVAGSPETEGAISGGCLCGKVRYEFDESLGVMGYCHCSRCRRARSAPHSAQLFVAPGKFRWLSGEDNLEHFHLPGADFFIQTFCRDCGSVMPTVHEERGVTMVPAGSMDQDPGVKPQAHIYVGSKAPWFEITDDLIQFEEMPPNAPV